VTRGKGGNEVRAIIIILASPGSRKVEAPLQKSFDQRGGIKWGSRGVLLLRGKTSKIAKRIFEGMKKSQG